MAREESSREDLLREATALVERIEFVTRGIAALSDAHIVAGFRSDGALSLFFADDPVYQFNAAGELRRAYCDGKLLKAVRGQLVAFDRTRTANEVQLVRHELSEAEQSNLVARMAELLRRLEASLNANAIEIVGQIPPETDIIGRLKAWLAGHKQYPIAQRPNVS